MAASYRWCVFVALFAAIPASAAQDFTEPPATLLTRARELVQQKPTPARWLALAEMYQASGNKDAALECLRAAETAANDDKGRGELHDLLCWRMLPVSPPHQERFRQELQKGPQTGSWRYLFQLVDCVVLQPNRKQLLRLAENLPERWPAAFPGPDADLAHVALLQDLGFSRTRAALKVLDARSNDSLESLRDLDRGLEREFIFLKDNQRGAEADSVRAVQKRLREAYHQAARRLSEKLFALEFTGSGREALLAPAKEIGYVSDRKLLAELLDSIDEAAAWDELVRPLLHHELELLRAPPNLDRLRNLHVKFQATADKQLKQAGATLFQGHVRIALGSKQITCNDCSLLGAPDQPGFTLSGQGTVAVRGLPGAAMLVEADRFTYNADTGRFTFGGTVRIHHQGGIVKLTSCTITRGGDLRDQSSLLDDFRLAFSVTRRQALLPALTRVYGDDELPDEGRYLLALELLRPHLSWHAPYLPPAFERRGRKDLDSNGGSYRTRWLEAMRGETWMRGDVSLFLIDLFQRDVNGFLKTSHRKDEKVSAADFAWRIRDPRHADVARALKLLRSIRVDDVGRQAARWIGEIERNNTVLTFDTPGSCSPGRPAALLMDVRNAERVSFKLYRVKQPEELLWVLGRIGDDFLFRNHDMDARLDEIKMGKYGEMMEKRARSDGKDVPQPNFQPKQLVLAWDAQVDSLKALTAGQSERGRRHRWDRDWDDYGSESDTRYFDDHCQRFRPRLDKDYRWRYGTWSSWRCDRIVEVPGKALADPGGYILVAESNGQAAYVPLLVKPLSLTLRRNRDGVFVLASDHEGKKPLAGAQVFAAGMVNEPVTDAQGAAFARVFAAGDRAILVHHQGQYAVGGFGEVFEGIYQQDRFRYAWDRWAWRGGRDAKLRALEELESVANVYADRQVVVAYTDRPTYRPGQLVQFKLIVRKMLSDSKDKPKVQGFRAEDFDQPIHWALPEVGRKIHVAVNDARGREVAVKELKLNDFGTLSSEVHLDPESALGVYSLRVTGAGPVRIVPDVFAVKSYRLPNIDLQIDGVPDVLKLAASGKIPPLRLHVSAKYFFGQSVAKGRVSILLFGTERARPLARAEETLDAQGKGQVEVELPSRLDSGDYILLCSVTDESDRTVSKSLRLRVQRPQAAKEAAALVDLPRFHPVGQALQVGTTMPVVHAEREDGTGKPLNFRVKGGVAAVKLPLPGWYTLKVGNAQKSIFAYGGEDHPLVYERARPEEPGQRHRAVEWVNLSDVSWQEHGTLARWEDPAQHLFALFDRQQATVGDKLRVLVFVPYNKARLLFTFEGQTVLDYHVTATAEKAGAYQVIELPITRRHAPNCYVQGRILSFEEIRDQSGKPGQSKEPERFLEEDRAERRDPRWCRLDVADPQAAMVTGSLKVQIETDRAEYRPGEAVSAKIKVTNPQGQPQQAEVSLAAVDEGVFTFGEDGLQRLPRLFQTAVEPRFYSARSWRSSIGNARSEAQAKKDGIVQNLEKAIRDQKMAQASVEGVLRQLREEERQGQAIAHLQRPLGEMPAAQIPLARLRQDFRETAAWLPHLRTGPDGLATTTFKLPDSLTQYRLTAVALTKATEVGIGQGKLTASMPLAVQVVVPRFAVESDRLFAVGLIHNATNAPRTCDLEWTIAGAAMEAGPARVEVPAKGTARVGVWMSMNAIGTAKITLKAGDAKDADAETRTVRVQPLGREQEVATNQALVRIADKGGQFNQQQEFTLPKGFVADELHLGIGLTRIELVQALDGLDYLVDYPYGCIEQTMSRFFPAVVVKHTTYNTPLTLSRAAADKLPDVLSKGLTRVYNHQHPDGSWGFFTDSRNNEMTVYVVYGLARCQAAGEAVDQRVLERGGDFLKGQLQGGKMPPVLAAKAWHALALAGLVDRATLEATARQALKGNSPRPALWHFALACRAAGLSDLSRQLWRASEDWIDSTDTQLLALRLRCQVAFGEPFDQCWLTARTILTHRIGQRWANTHATAWAIEALADLVAFLPDPAPVRRMQVQLGDKTVLTVTDPQELKRMVHRLHFKADELPLRENLTIRVLGDTDETLFFSLRAMGTQRLSEVKPSGQRVQLLRSFETLEGKPLSGPLTAGQVFRVRLRLELARAEQYVLVEDRRPTTCEFADEQVQGTLARAAVQTEFRDDRLCVFFTSLPAGGHELVYYLRAETAGTCQLLPGCAYPMYDEKARGETAGGKLEIRQR